MPDSSIGIDDEETFVEPAKQSVSSLRANGRRERAEALPSATVTFPQGLPGSPGSADYHLGRLPNAPSLLRLRNHTGAGPDFVVVPRVGSGGLLDEEDGIEACAAVGANPSDVLVLLVATAWRDGNGLQVAVNRRAPILIDERRRLGFQVVLPRPDYAVRHALQCQGVSPAVGGTPDWTLRGQGHG